MAIKEFKEHLKNLKSEMEKDPRWIKDWNIDLCNYETKRSYSGINVLLLSMLMSQRGHNKPYFLTFNQAKNKGYKVRKGAKAYPIFFYKIYEKEVVKENEDGEEKVIETIPILRKYYVFNIEDIEGIEISDANINLQKDIEHILNTIKRYVSISYGNPSWIVGTDTILMPKISEFESIDAYMAALFHEIGHWTGKDKRKYSYAEEEVIAELISVLLCKKYGINYPLERHAGYIKSWSSQIEEKFFYRAIKEAFNGFTYVCKIIEEGNEDEELAKVA